MKRDGFAPAVGGDLSFVGVERDDDVSSRDSAGEGAEEAQVEFAFGECGAADDDLRRAESGQLFSARDAADATAYAYIHFVIAAGAFAEGRDKGVVVIFFHGGVEIDDVQPFVAA